MSEARAEVLEDRTEEPARGSVQRPSSWAMARIDQVCDKPQYGWTTKAVDKGSIQLLRTTDISSGQVNWLTVPYCEANPDDPSKYYLQSGDIVVSRAGSVGKSFIIKDPNTAVFASYLVRLRPRITPQYLHFFMQSQMYWTQISDKTSGIAVPNVNASKLASIALPLAPLAEQKRIVSKIDELFSDIEAGERALRRARAALARYRKSVLKAAVTGELTADWRAANRERLEPADKLLTRILAARREAWEKAERAKLEGQGKSAKGEEWKKRHKKPMEFVEVSNAELPTTWQWCSLDAVSWSSSYGTSIKCSYDSNGVSVLRIPNVRIGKINFDDLKFAASDSEFEEEDLVSAGDLLIVRTNGSEDIIGIGAVVDKSPAIPTYFASYLIRFRLLTIEPALADWVNAVWQSEIIRDQIRRHAATSAGQYNVSQSNMARFAIPLPPAVEQTEIVSRVEEAFSKADHVEAALDEQERAARALKQSILKAAFEGRLVPQDGADEPAAKLLERIKKARK